MLEDIVHISCSEPHHLSNCRELPALSKQFVMRLLWVHQAVPQAVVSSWVTPHYAKVAIIICVIILIITIIVLMPCPGERPRHGGAVRAAAVAVHEHAGRAGGVAAQRNLPSQPAHGAQRRGPGGRGRYC